jgi:hypothetical protein
LCVTRSTEAPLRALACAASHPACPPPMTTTSYALLVDAVAVADEENTRHPLLRSSPGARFSLLLLRLKPRAAKRPTPRRSIAPTKRSSSHLAVPRTRPSLQIWELEFSNSTFFEITTETPRVVSQVYLLVVLSLLLLGVVLSLIFLFARSVRGIESASRCLTRLVGSRPRPA